LSIKQQSYASLGSLISDKQSLMMNLWNTKLKININILKNTENLLL